MATQLAFYFDQSRCMSCNACTVSCKDWNQVNPGPVSWRKQNTYEEKNGSSTEFLPFSMSCNHCEEPACVDACPTEAITKSEDGIVRVDRNECISALSCITACPFGAPKIADDRQEPKPIIGWQVEHPMQKCDFCSELLDKGERPICVRSCVGRALDFGTLDSLAVKYPTAVRINEGTHGYLYERKGKPDTKPSILVKPKTQPAIHQEPSTYEL